MNTKFCGPSFENEKKSENKRRKAAFLYMFGVVSEVLNGNVKSLNRLQFLRFLIAAFIA
jgi:hypothetical protein